VEKALSIAPSMQKLMYKGLLKNDTDTLEKVRSPFCPAVVLAAGAVAMEAIGL
jgi:hypothetical protein